MSSNEVFGLSSAWLLIHRSYVLVKYVGDIKTAMSILDHPSITELDDESISELSQFRTIVQFSQKISRALNEEQDDGNEEDSVISELETTSELYNKIMQLKTMLEPLGEDLGKYVIHDTNKNEYKKMVTRIN